MRTFRRIRPLATLGLYAGTARAPDAEILFASIQSLSRRRHLLRFGPWDFDYRVLEEVHHAAARSYRRLIGTFEPRFLLGLTATPQRTDGADLMSLCGDGLVWQNHPMRLNNVRDALRLVEVHQQRFLEAWSRLNGQNC